MSKRKSFSPEFKRKPDRYDYQLKFVADNKKDFLEIEEILAKLKTVDRSCVLVMAQATTKSELHEKGPWIVELCKKHGFSYTPRLHVELYGNRRGTLGYACFFEGEINPIGLDLNSRTSLP
jgi:organic radical activating enzyme